MSNNEIIENEDLNDHVEVESGKGSSNNSGFGDKLKNWLNSQNKLMVYGVGGLLVIAIGYAAYKYLYQNPREAEANAAVYSVETLFSQDSFKLVLKDGPKLSDKFSGTKAGNIVTYMTGVSYLKTGDYKKAIEYLNKVEFEGTIMPSSLTGLRGDAYIENKELDKGYDLYVKAAKMTEVPSDAVRWFKKAARVCEKKENWKQALEHYEYIKENYREEPSASDVDKYIARAKAKLQIY